MCNSSHSRVLGFFSTLPPIWRFLQCIRRYKDTRNAFPHLVNAGKYSATILMYTMLSLWRIDGTITYQALFVVFASVNTLYCCTSCVFGSLTHISVLGYLYGLVTWTTARGKSISPSRSRLQASMGTSSLHPPGFSSLLIR
jgi:hypothetical protein